MGATAAQTAKEIVACVARHQTDLSSLERTCICVFVLLHHAPPMLSTRQTDDAVVAETAPLGALSMSHPPPPFPSANGEWRAACPTNASAKSDGVLIQEQAHGTGTIHDQRRDWKGLLLMDRLSPSFIPLTCPRSPSSSSTRMASIKSQPSDVKDTDGDHVESIHAAAPRKRNPFRTTFTQATILGVCSFLAPGICESLQVQTGTAIAHETASIGGAMAATGGGGTQSVSLVNAANSSTFSLMVVTALLTPTFIHLTNVRWALIFGTLGYAPYAAGLYTHQKYGTDWFVVFGAVLCGISAGTFWASEGAIILSVSVAPHLGDR